MELFTRVQVKRLPALYYSDTIVCLGSCFADRMGKLFQEARFQATVNPHGVLFNPVTTADTVRRAITSAKVSNLTCEDGLWVSLDYHSKLAGASEQETIEKITCANTQLRSALFTARWLVLTLGTAWVYRHRVSKCIVANCHHLPATHFVRELLSAQAIVDAWTTTILQLRQMNRNLRVLLTVSPVRHLRDGMMDNSVSKATLLLAAHTLVNTLQEVYYFPSYEIMLDELRDYRFYESDMIQPNDTARRYIWSQLVASWFAPETAKLLASIEQCQQMQEHLPRNTNSEGYKLFCRKRDALALNVEETLRQARNVRRRDLD